MKISFSSLAPPVLVPWIKMLFDLTKICLIKTILSFLKQSSRTHCSPTPPTPRPPRAFFPCLRPQLHPRPLPCPPLHTALLPRPEFLIIVWPWGLSVAVVRLWPGPAVSRKEPAFSLSPLSRSTSIPVFKRDRLRKMLRSNSLGFLCIFPRRGSALGVYLQVQPST